MVSSVDNGRKPVSSHIFWAEFHRCHLGLLSALGRPRVSDLSSAQGIRLKASPSILVRGFHLHSNDHSCNAQCCVDTCAGIRTPELRQTMSKICKVSLAPNAPTVPVKDFLVVPEQ